MIGGDIDHNATLLCACLHQHWESPSDQLEELQVVANKKKHTGLKGKHTSTAVSFLFMLFLRC